MVEVHLLSTARHSQGITLGNALPPDSTLIIDSDFTPLFNVVKDLGVWINNSYVNESSPTCDKSSVVTCEVPNNHSLYLCRCCFLSMQRI